VCPWPLSCLIVSRTPSWLEPVRTHSGLDRSNSHAIAHRTANVMSTTESREVITPGSGMVGVSTVHYPPDANPTVVRHTQRHTQSARVTMCAACMCEDRCCRAVADRSLSSCAALRSSCGAPRVDARLLEHPRSGSGDSLHTRIQRCAIRRRAIPARRRTRILASGMDRHQTSAGNTPTHTHRYHHPHLVGRYPIRCDS
jgi:hypothetical protein